MRVVFADSFYFFALLSKTDEAHRAAVAFTESCRGELVTTDWVLTEVADGLASTRAGRTQFLRLHAELFANPRVRVLPLARSLHDDALTLYRERPDKQWTLTDCVSFVVMQREGIVEALTGDRHFEQAGLNGLLRS